MMDVEGLHLSELACTIRAGLRDPRLALGYLELGAKLNGGWAAQHVGPTRR